MNKSFLFSIVALTACAFADGDTTNSNIALADDLVAGRMDSDCNPKPKECPPKPECKPKPKPCEPCVRKGMAPIVLTSSRPCNDAGVYLFADALYWHADVSNSDWAFANQNTAAIPTTGTNEEVTFKWNWGFKAGLGLDLDHDQWDTNVYYTWFRNNSTGSSFTTTAAASAASSLNSDFPGDPISVTSGSASAKLHFNVLDWELGRSFYVSNSLSVRPHVGVKGAMIKLSETDTFASLVAPTTYTVSNKTKSWAVGPSAGINSNWYFGCGNTMPHKEGRKHNEVKDRPVFSIFGDVAGALMYGHFKNRHTESGVAAGVVSAGFNPSGLNRNLMVPVLTGAMGLAWDVCLDCDKMHLGIRAGYELQYWFRQSQRFSFDSLGTTPRYARSTGDLALQGLTIDVRFDF